MERESISSNLGLNKSSTFSKFYQFYINNDKANMIKYKHKSNKLDTTKYNILTFLPKSLLLQFFRLANCYFLIIAIIQCIPEISPLTPTTAIAPIAFVLLVSIIREGLEDYERYKYDRLMNRESVFILESEKFKITTSGKLRVGNIILIRENDLLPADSLLLDSDLDDGSAFVETATLDGEKALKLKNCIKGSVGFFKYRDNSYMSVNSNVRVSGQGVCDMPNSELYKLEGSLDLTIADVKCGRSFKSHFPVGVETLLLKGSVLRNTKWVVCLVVYTGKNTKLILNNKKAKYKFSRVETLMSKMLVSILVLQILLCLLCSLLNYSCYKAEIEDGRIQKVSKLYDSFINYFTYMLLLNTMIPISLIITLEVVKLIQGYFIRVDTELFSFARGKFSKAGSVSLNEELGAVNYIFSDKTGTLTTNKMEFKFCVIGDVLYKYRQCIDEVKYLQSGAILNEINEVNESVVSFADLEMLNKVQEGNSPYLENGSSLTDGKFVKAYPGYKVKDDQCPDLFINMHEHFLVVDEFWKAISLAHECICDSTGEYKGMSPDDVELVKTASRQGYVYSKSTVDTRILKIGEKVKEFQVLKILSFTSERKRMSIIVREDGLIKLYTKGADSEIKSRLSKNSLEKFESQTSKFVDLFSDKGYRTLLVGMKVLDENTYQYLNNKLLKAELNLKNKIESVNLVYSEIEKDLYLLGATIVEDKLQDGVSDTIRDLGLAGIKIWMLTGDKMNTAMNIGLSCNLISKSIKLFTVDGESGESSEKLFNEFHNFCLQHNEDNNGNGSNNENEFKSSMKSSHPFSLIIDAVSLAAVMKSKCDTKSFLHIASQAKSVICCRVSPLQKASLVKEMKSHKEDIVALSIGDGGNDVSMITEAHIGVGVYGEEGMQAVQASDFAIGEFKLLRRLLMFHGRTNLIRISQMILYFFFKNFLFTIIQFYYGFYNSFSGQTVYDDWFISLYNMIFTAVPLCVMALSDFDVKPEDSPDVQYLMPFLYKETREAPIFTKYNFMSSLFRGVAFAALVFFFIIYSLNESSVDAQGNSHDLWYTSTCLFTSIIFIVTFRLVIITRYFILLMPVLIFLTSWVLYFSFLIYVNTDENYKSSATMNVVFNSGKFYLNLLFVIIGTLGIDKAIIDYELLFSNSFKSTLMRMRGGVNLDQYPDNIKEALRKYSQIDRLNTPIERELESRQSFKVSDWKYSNLMKIPAKTLRDSCKFSRELMLMEAPYKKKVSENLEKRISDMINEKKEDSLNMKENE